MASTMRLTDIAEHAGVSEATVSRVAGAAKHSDLVAQHQNLYVLRR